tara:strand:- start:1971 stop:2237 length:267 start_codon:yes stop_codon:yes gene_type:complete
MGYAKKIPSKNRLARHLSAAFVTCCPSRTCASGAGAGPQVVDNQRLREEVVRLCFLVRLCLFDVIGYFHVLGILSKNYKNYKKHYLPY